ncbi:hypothetical protein I4U23_013816 [Adineta vaga]|nr:hypothetical protein I4U23_013816 [Adineta vaga]
MNINHFFTIILFLIENLSLINPIICSLSDNNNNNDTKAMLILPTSYVNDYFKRRLSKRVVAKNVNLTDDRIISTTNQMHRTLISNGMHLTKTQIKVILTVVLIISFIMIIIAIFRFKNACRHQEEDNLQTDIIRSRAAQYNEPSSRRGSVGYYTQKYTRAPGNRLDEQLNIPLPSKRLSIPACDHSSKLTAVVISSSSSIDPTVRTDDFHQHHHQQQHVTSSCDTSTSPNQERFTASILSNDLKSVSQQQSDCNIGISGCDDQTPLLKTELISTIKNSSNHTTRKYSLNALLPLVRPSNSHPLCSSLTSTNADGENSNGNSIDLKSRRRATLTSVLRRNSFAKQPRAFCSTIDSTTTTIKTISPPTCAVDSDSSDRSSFLPYQSSSSKNHHYRKKSSSITPIGSTILSSYQKAFMQKIERFRFIDDSASSTTTVTSPVESIERVSNHQVCSHLITNSSNHRDDYNQIKYLHTTDEDDDETNSLIDRLNADILTNGSYSDMNIFNQTISPKPILRSQTFKPVNGKSLQPITNLSTNQTNDYQRSTPINIPHSNTTLPLSKQRNQVDVNGHSRSMDFHSLATKRDLIRPVALISTIHETSSSSSTTTLTSIRSLTSLEFDDNSKPSGVLVDDDFLPMSSPIDEHFWDVTSKSSSCYTNTECFPNVGSSPDIEVKHFDLQQLNTLSETSCDEDDEDDSVSSMNQPEKFSIYEFKVKELQKPLVTLKPISSAQKISEENLYDKSSSTPSMIFAEQSGNNSNSNSTSVDQTTDESLSLKSPIKKRSDFYCDTINSQSQIISEEDDTQESSANDASEGDDSADNGEIDLVQEFELSQKEEEENKTSHLWTTDDRDIFVMQEDDLLSALITTPTEGIRTQPTSIMKMTNNKTSDNSDDQTSQQQQQQQQQTSNTLKPKVRFNLDPQYEREREWNKVTKILGNSVEWTDEFEV